MHSPVLMLTAALGQLLGPPPAPPADLDTFRVAPAVVERVAGRDCLAKGDHDGAIRHFSQALEEQPDDAATLIDRARAWAGRKDDDSEREFADLSRAIELDPTSATARARRGAIRRSEADDARVDADLAEAFRLDPGNAEALAARGQCLMARDDWEGALKDLDAAVAGGLRDADLFQTRAINRLHRRDAAGALADLDAAMQGRPLAADEATAVAFLRNTAHLVAGQYDRALGELDAMLKLAPDQFEDLVFRAKTLEALGRYAEARAAWDDLVRDHPRDVVVWQSRAFLHRQEGDYAAALADIEAALRLQPTAAAPVLLRAGVELRQHRYDRALADYQGLASLDPASITVGIKAGALSGIAWVRATCPDASVRDATRAIEAGTRACELTDRRDAHALTNLAAAHAEAGHFDRAIELAEAALKLPEPNPVAKQVDPTSGRFGVTYSFPPVDQAQARAIRAEALAGYRAGRPYRDRR